MSVLSRAEGVRQRRAIQRDIDHDLREKAAAKLRALGGELHEARGHRNAALASAKEKCRAERVVLREQAFARRRRTLAELRETYAKERADARDVCLIRKAEVHANARDPIERARGHLDAERAYQEDLRRIERGNRQRHRETHRAHAHERRSESDDLVASNVPPDYLALWRRVKRSIKGSDRESRTEAFLRYAEQHPDELLASLDDDSDRIVRELEEQQARAGRALRARPVRKASSRAEPTVATEDYSAVPF